MSEAKQYLSNIQDIVPNFVKHNIEQMMQQNKEGSEFQQILDFIEKARVKLQTFPGNHEGEEDELVKYSLCYDENQYLTSVLKTIKSHIDALFLKYDPRTMPLKQHPISEMIKYQPTDE